MTERKRSSTSLIAGCVIVTAMIGGYAYHEGKSAGAAAAVADIQARRVDGPWAHVAKTLELGPGETLRKVSIQHPVASVLDPQCLIYTNSETKTAAITCPEVSQVDLHDND